MQIKSHAQTGCYETRALNEVKERCSGYRSTVLICVGVGFCLCRRGWGAEPSCGCSAGQFCYELPATEHVHHSFQVVDHGRQADLCLCTADSAQQEARMSKDAVLERGKRMFHRGSPQPHVGGRDSLLHPFQGIVMQMTRRPAPRGGRTASFHRTGSAYLRWGGIHHAAIFAGELDAHQRLPGRTAKGIGLRVIVELAAVEQRAIALVVVGAVGGYMRHDALLLTTLDLLAVGVTGIGDHVQRFRSPDGLLAPPRPSAADSVGRCLPS